MRCPLVTRAAARPLCCLRDIFVWLLQSYFREMYDKAMDGATNILLKRSSPSRLAFLSDWDGSRNNLKMDHLVCFAAGMLALGAHTADGTKGEANKWRDLKNGKALGYTCYQVRLVSSCARVCVVMKRAWLMIVTSLCTVRCMHAWRLALQQSM